MKFVVREHREASEELLIVHDSECKSVKNATEAALQEAESVEALIRADRQFRVDQGDLTLPDYEVHACASAEPETSPDGTIVIFTYGDGHCNAYLRTSSSTREWSDYALRGTYDSVYDAKKAWPDARYA